MRLLSLPPAAAGEPWLMTVIAVLCFLACLAAVGASAADRAAGSSDIGSVQTRRSRSLTSGERSWSRVIR